MKKIKALKCKECGQESPPIAKHVCEFCFGPLEVVYDYEWISSVISKEKIASRPHNLWRYWELLPVEGQQVLSLNEGFTPFWKSRNLGKFLDFQKGVNPSFKKRTCWPSTGKSSQYLHKLCGRLAIFSLEITELIHS